jgi:hypothetical protein
MMQEKRQQRSPKEENNLHNTNRKGSLKHGTRLIHIQRKRVIRSFTKRPKRTQGNPDRASMPAGAVCVRDEAKLVDTCDESAEEAQVDEGDEDR